MSGRLMDDVGLSQFLAECAPNVHALDFDGFRNWLVARIREHERHDVFRQKCRIRDLVRQNLPHLELLAAAVEQARNAYERSRARDEIERCGRQIARLEKGVRGLYAAVQEGRADPAKLAAHQALLERSRESYADLLKGCPAKVAVDRAEEALVTFRAAAGLTSEEAALQTLQRRRGRRSGVAGSQFETTTALAIERILIPSLPTSERPRVLLRGVTLGAARAEFDFLVVEEGDDEFVEVLAMVEAKRNIDDVVIGFVNRQENLAWLTGDAARYDAAAYRTHHFLSGHFDRPAVHREDGRNYRFDRRSFQGFRRDLETGSFLERLHFATEFRPVLGCTGLELSKILHRVATDPEFDVDSAKAMRRLHRRVLAFVKSMQTRDVLADYQKRSLSGRILRIDREANGK